MDTILRLYRNRSMKTGSILLIALIVSIFIVLSSVSGVVGSTENLSLVLNAKHLHQSKEKKKNPSEQSVSSSQKGKTSIATKFVTEEELLFLGRNEPVILDKLTNSSVIEVKASPGGRSVAFRLTLNGGMKAFYKPEQTFSAAHFNSEIVAYYLDRALGLKRVPPTVSREMLWSKLNHVVAKHRRKKEVVISEDGKVKGAMIFWMPKRLEPLETPPGWENWVRIEQWPKWKISPCQRPKLYQIALAKQRANRGKELKYLYFRTPEPDSETRGGELSDMLVFDFLTLNVDRFGGDNCNILLHGKGGPLIFLDNGAGFSPGPPRRNLMDVRLNVAQRFRRSTIDALRLLDIESFAAMLARDRLAPLLTKSQIKGLKVRRQVVLDRVAMLEKRFGDKAIFPW